MVAAPATVPFLKNERRLLPFVNTFSSFFVIGLSPIRFINEILVQRSAEQFSNLSGTWYLALEHWNPSN
jgi:hypothetical protein